MRELLSIETALERILERAGSLPPETVQLGEAADRVLAEAALATVDLPPFPSSAMDGFALRAADTPGALPVASRIAAGRPGTGPLPPGAAAGIATGGAVPEGADAVVPVERTLEHNGTVEIRDAAQPGAHIRPRAGDVGVGAVVVEPGTRLGPIQIGALAATGISEVLCARRPRVAVLATGSELRAPGDPLAPGEIYESNRPMIATTLAGTGADVELLPVVVDEESAHREALAQGLTFDVLVTSGGVSMGPHDLVRRIEGELGVEEVFWGVAVKPGKPLSFGTRANTLVFGLPGNPVSSLVGALLFVRPALLQLQGLSDPRPAFERGEAAIGLRRNAQRDEFLRARRRIEDGRTLLDPVVGQESHMIVRAATADALAHVPRGEGEIAAGEPIRYLTLV
jgi:molybdopterin molybdotransferase